MNAYATAGWESFFVAEVGAAAALTGLLFVSVSINLAKILALPQLPGRAGESLVMLMGVVVVATLGLVPGQTVTAYGVEVLICGLLVWLGPLRIQQRAAHLPGMERRWVLIRAAFHQVGALPTIVAGISIVAHAGGGLYWLVPGTLLAIIASVINSWILLVEILR